VIAVGLTGGIGSGKSAVAALLVARGAVLIDADELAREAVKPGTDGLGDIVKCFGEEVLTGSGELDRPKLAAIVFADPAARRQLDGIVHPRVGALMGERLAALASTDQVVVLDIPLLVEAGGRNRYEMAGVLVVDTPVETALERLIAIRGMSREDAEARVAAQASRTDRLRQADYVILNVGTLEELALMVDRAWNWMLGLKAAQAS
jgi:dephospho-CoA kinase